MHIDMAAYPLGSFAQSGQAWFAEWPAGFPVQIPTNDRRHPVVTPEDLFTGLDGREVRSGSTRAVIEIYSVSDQSGHRWIQMGLHGGTEVMFTVEVPASLGPQEVSRAIETLMGHPGVLDLSQTA